jgi:hypothetical protein
MWHIGEHRPAEAWQDLFALHRLGRLVAQGPSLVEQLVGLAIANGASNGTITLLHEGQPSADEARQIMNDLATLPYFNGFGTSMDGLERLSFLDTVTRLGSGEVDPETLKMIGMSDDFDFLGHVRVDWNTALRKGNQFYDRYVAAARLPTFAERQNAFAQIEMDVQRMAQSLGVDTVVAAVLSPSSRSDAVASIVIAQFMPAVEAVMNAQDRANTTLDLTRLAAAITVYRAEHGNYPEKLDNLAPGVLNSLPVDLYRGLPFSYKRIADGYLLYSFGPNGQDDDGSNSTYNIIEGQSLDDFTPSQADALRQKISPNADDISIRVPRPPLIPKEPPAQ